MSPLPSPTPMRRTFLRILFSPAGLLCGFVVLLITTCPGARGDDTMGLLAATGGLHGSTGGDLTSLDALLGSTGGSAEIGRVPAASLRSPLPTERGAVGREPRPSILSREDVFPHSRIAIPMLVAPLPGDANTTPASAALAPRTGPAVGVPRKLPVSFR